jgi:HPr kinase/phosphorylase
MAYLGNLGASELRRRVEELCSHPIPCLVVSRGRKPPAVLMEVAEREGIALFATSMITMKFINAATIVLEEEFAPTCTEYGSMVDIMGVGVLVRGSSGIGKSECVLNLIERGYSLVSDDITIMRAVENREIIGTSPDLTRFHMEVRGLGIINIIAVFGIGGVRTAKHLDLVVTFKDWQEVEEVDRVGMDREYYQILGILVPHVTIPVRVGRDLARLVEVAALDQKLKIMGHNSALEFNERLMRRMQEQTRP